MAKCRKFFGRSSSNSGLSFIEMLIAILLLQIVLLSLGSVLMYGFNMLTKMKEINLATQIAQEEMEIIRNMSFDEVSNLDSRFLHDRIFRLEYGQGHIVLDKSLGPDIIKVTVKVTWFYRREGLSKEIVTYVTRRGINRSE